MLTDVFDILRDNWLLLLVGQYPNGPLGGIAATLLLSVLGIGLAFPLSVLTALARLSPWLVLRWPATALVYVMRGVPLLMITRMTSSRPPELSLESSGPYMPETKVGLVWQTPHDCSNSRRPNFCCSLR